MSNKTYLKSSKAFLDKSNMERKLLKINFKKIPLVRERGGVRGREGEGTRSSNLEINYHYLFIYF